MSEEELRALVLEQAEALELLTFYKGDSRHITTPRGFPDLVLAGPGGVLFRELKAETGRITNDQAYWLQTLRKGGADACIWQPGDWNNGAIRFELRRLASTPC